MGVKYIFITGGVVSGLGKGITGASLGRLLKARGYRVYMQKFDPYLNVDPGTMNPIQHGEVFVTEDGAETDLDLGHYERFIDEFLNQKSNVTSGKIYWNLLNKERRGDYQGKTVQVVPHVTNEIKDSFYRGSKEQQENREDEIAIIEIGGTVGDIESQPFIEAIRQFKHDAGHENCIMIHVTLIPYLQSSLELKTKPTQASVKALQSLGIQPDILVCRCDYPLNEEIKQKIALFCNIEEEYVIENSNVEILYEVVEAMEKEHLAQAALKCLRLPIREADLADWKQMLYRWKNPRHQVTVALVGKYVSLHDAYLSVAEALKHGGVANYTKVDIKWVDSEEICSENVDGKLGDADGIIVPGGFGSRGIEGILCAIRYAREQEIPYFGICFGMQLALVEYGRNVLGYQDADSTELDENTTHPMIHILPDKKNLDALGGTLRLGSYPCILEKGSRAYKAYGEENIQERHRHRYEVNNAYLDELKAKGMDITGLSPDGKIVEMIELKNHPWFVATQAHPEFKSRPNKAHPLFQSFIEAALKNRSGKNSTNIGSTTGVREACGVFGMYDLGKGNVGKQIYYGLASLQHRGQEACGIAVSNTQGPKGNLEYKKGIGLVQEVFREKDLEKLSGDIGIGHVRYSTSGDKGEANTQPVVLRYIKGTLAFAHNGNIANASAVRRELELDGAIFQTDLDSEVAAYCIARERLHTATMEEAVRKAGRKLKGAYALLVMSPKKLMGVRDPYGFKPLCIGKKDNAYVLASESCALSAIGAEFIRDVEPGEMVSITPQGIESDKSMQQEKQARCIFEYIYFARADSKLDGVNVYDARIQAGRALATSAPVEADLVVGVPESGIVAAQGYTLESGIPFGIAFYKNSYVGRTFIKPEQSQRADGVKMKLSVFEPVVRGKRIVVIDDSIVRGTTCANIVQMLRDAGASQVHVRISSPPFRYPCYFGTDVPSNDQLIASRHSTEAIRELIGADSLAYIRCEDLKSMTGGLQICSACFDGNYPMQPDIDIA